MAVELLGFPKMDEQTAIQEVASAGLKSMEHLIRLISHQTQTQQQQPPPPPPSIRTNRTGHARFRRGPACPPSVPDQAPALTLAPANSSQSLTLDFKKSNLLGSNPKATEMYSTSQLTKETFSISPPMSSSSSSFVSSITGEGSVSNGKQLSSLFLAPSAPAASAGKPPRSSSKRCLDHDHDHSGNVSGKISVSGRCHCSKKRKSRVKRTIRIPAISSKVADIPSDEYSWRKYGQKPIKGSSYPRGYYKCSSVRGCPARKHVERATDDPAMLIVTYEGEHRHSQGGMQENIPGGMMGLVFESM